MLVNWIFKSSLKLRSFEAVLQTSEVYKRFLKFGDNSIRWKFSPPTLPLNRQMTGRWDIKAIPDSIEINLDKKKEHFFHWAFVTVIFPASAETTFHRFLSFLLRILKFRLLVLQSFARGCRKQKKNMNSNWGRRSGCFSLKPTNRVESSQTFSFPFRKKKSEEKPKEHKKKFKFAGSFETRLSTLEHRPSFVNGSSFVLISLHPRLG